MDAQVILLVGGIIVLGVAMAAAASYVTWRYARRLIDQELAGDEPREAFVCEACAGGSAAVYPSRQRAREHLFDEHNAPSTEAADHFIASAVATDGQLDERVEAEA